MLSSLLTACLPSPSSPPPTSANTPTSSSSKTPLNPSSGSPPRGSYGATFPPPADEARRVPGCIFCDVKAEKGFGVVYEDERFVVFNDRSPGSKVHLLAVPRKHVDNVKILTRDDLGMLKEMGRVGSKVLEEQMGVPPALQRMGFHIPPFFSVNHLHLHLLSLPMPFPGSIKYRPSFPSPPAADAHGRERVKGWSWFVEIGQVMRILEAGKRVRVTGVSVEKLES